MGDLDTFSRHSWVWVQVGSPEASRRDFDVSFRRLHDFASTDIFICIYIYIYIYIERERERERDRETEREREREEGARNGGLKISESCYRVSFDHT